jgi:DNA mismatch repair protein MutS
MRQFLQIKAQYPDAILFFRMGDFYEMFFDDAIEVAPVLDIAVTTRDKGVEDPVPMAGIPYHALGGYLRTLVERGMKVAICEQMESPDEARKRKGPDKIVRREVVRVVTPGALIDEEHLRPGEPNYLGAVVADAAPDPATPGPGGACAIALCDISSSDFIVIAVETADMARAELARFAPREIIAAEAHHAWLRATLQPDPPRLEPASVPSDEARARVRTLAADSGTTLTPGLEQAAALVLAYAESTQPGQTILLHRLRRHEPAHHLVLDEASVRNLELFRTLRDGQRRGSLLWAIDATQTAMGGRMLRSWLAAPCRDFGRVKARLDAIEALIIEPRLRAELQSRLRDVRDVVRLTARARLGTINPRELGALRSSLEVLPALDGFLRELAGRRTDRELPELLSLGGDLLPDVLEDLQATLVDTPPALSREGGMIRSGADPFLDEQRRLRDGGREALAAIETRERARTGIGSLRVQHNRVFGYFLEVPKAHLKHVPDDYVRKQTLANGERYVTEELAGHEARVLGAQAQALQRELELYAELRRRVSAQGERLCRVGERVATLDVLAGLAEIAQRYGYCRPELVEEPVLDLEDARHPVVERMIDSGRFVPNDVALNAATTRLWVITGPNMGGKSTVMRQAALITILAHMGSFVPAARARVGLTDRVFTRVGAADDLGRGDSTFMVEMRETAQILASATPRSLVLLDEIGRGTSTFDGLAIAWAVTEFLHDQVGCRTMFATHYHELTALEGVLAGVQNVHVTVHEQRGNIVFLHRLQQGAAGRSYGVAVGRLAGLPAGVLRRASRILERLEADPTGAARPQLELFAPRPLGAPGRTPGVAPMPDGGESAAVLEELSSLEPDDLSPREAHDLLRELSARAARERARRS